MVLLLCPLLLVLAWPKFLYPAPDIYLIDYASRLVVIGAFVALGGWSKPGPDREWPWRKVAVATSVCLALLLALTEAEQMAAAHWPSLRENLYPSIESDALRLFDLTVGLALVAVAEELAFRTVFHSLWSVRGWPGLTLVSSVAFGLLHFPQGALAVLFTTLAGAVLMKAYRVSGTLWVPIGLHYAKNLVVFSG